MKAAIFALLIALPVSASEIKFEKLLDYENVTVTKIEKDGIRIIHSSGATKIPLELLSESVAVKLGYPSKEELSAKEKRGRDAARAKEAAELKEMVKDVKAAAIRKKEEAACMEIARRNHPEDAELRELAFQNQRIGFYYMKEFADDKEAKKIAQRDFPEDYFMQQHVYKSQIVAKNYMEKARDIELKAVAEMEWPGDYSMQKHVYDSQGVAKRYMSNQPSSRRKTLAIASYPNDYVMQKHVYDKIR